MSPLRTAASLCAALAMLTLPGISAARHPVGTVSPASAEAIGNPKLRLVECLDCHVSHGAADAGLLSGRDHGEAACLDCHQGLDLTTHAGSHPLDTLVPRRQAAALRQLGGVLGPNSTLVCTSCHTMHAEADMTDRCFACHEEQAITASVDPATKGHRSSACTDCHNADSATLKVESSRVPGDPGNCLRCHDEGSENQKVDSAPGHLGHPLVDEEGGFGPSDPPLEGCTSCHGGHEIVRPDYTLCEGCHLEQAEDHERGGHGTATCMECHPPHEARPMHAELADHRLNPVSRRCLSCHAEDSDAEASVARVESYEHPAPMFLPDGPRWVPPLGTLPLFDETGAMLPPTQNGDLTCESCHLSHGPDRLKPGDSLRRPGWEKACSACHGTDALLTYRWFHFRERLEGLIKPLGATE